MWRFGNVRRHLALFPAAAGLAQQRQTAGLHSEERADAPPRLTPYTRSPDFPPPELGRDGSKRAVWFRDVFSAVPPKEPDETMTARERTLYTWSAGEYIAARRAGAVTCEEYATALVKRARYYRYLNQWIYNSYGRMDKMVEQARALDAKAEDDGIESIGPLYGLPIPMKGTAAVIDYPSGSGVGVLSGHTPTKDSALTTLITQSNGLIFGCTNVPEFAANYTTNNPASGQTRNVYGHNLTVGGSSGGAASAVAAYMCPLAVTEDTGGSTRVPASCNQNFGFDPSRNHFDNEGNPGMSYTNDQLGVNARSIDDIILYDLALLPHLKELHAAGKHRVALRTDGSIRIGAPLLPYVHDIVGPGLRDAGRHLTLNADLMQKYKEVKAAFASAGFSIVDREWPSAYFDYLGRLENVCVEAVHTLRPINGSPIHHSVLGLRSFTGQVADFVDHYYNAPVSIREIKEDSEHGQWRAGRMDETQYRYWIGPKIKYDCEAYNSIFEENDLDVLLLPAGFGSTPDLFRIYEGTCTTTRLPGSCDGEGPLEKGGASAYFGHHCFTFKNLHIPKMVVPTGLTADGRPTAVQIWGKAVPYALMFDDSFAAKHDAEFLYLVRRICDAIQKKPGLCRKDAEMMVKDLHLPSTCPT